MTSPRKATKADTPIDGVPQRPAGGLIERGDWSSSYEAGELCQAIRSPAAPFASRRSEILSILESDGFALPSCCELDRYAASERPVAEIVAEWKTDPRCIVRTETYRMLERQAPKTTAYMIKARAHVYRRRPIELEAIAPGLMSANGDRLIAWGQHKLEFERKHLRRFFGFGGEIPAINAKACILLGRWRRRFEDQERRAA